jgi:hypothetical protein
MHSKEGESEFHYLQQNTCQSDHMEYLLQMTNVYKLFTIPFQFTQPKN